MCWDFSPNCNCVPRGKQLPKRLSITGPLLGNSWITCYCRAVAHDNASAAVGVGKLTSEMATQYIGRLMDQFRGLPLRQGCLQIPSLELSSMSLRSYQQLRCNLDADPCNISGIAYPPTYFLSFKKCFSYRCQLASAVSVVRPNMTTK